MKITKFTPFELTFGYKANLPSAIATTSSLTKNELINLWKTRHVKYINQAKENLKKAEEKYQIVQAKRIIKLQSILNYREPSIK